ncbi:MAG TPA: prepilin-type N-terminal cleavage/methylation domain-containing protein [Gemmatimonadales bacterium]|nr:prepilin-type N-terminal cleavage/methylation domain-containing protein [Gemmatimonadales bacterium]
MNSRGFTLIELLIVVVIIGILAVLAVPKFNNTKEKTYVAQMKSDLRNLATAEEAYFYDHTTYTPSLVLLNNFQPSSGVTITFATVNAQGWGASTTHANLPPPGKTCALFSGSVAPVPPATSDGHIVCQ